MYKAPHFPTPSVIPLPEDLQIQPQNQPVDYQCHTTRLGKAEDYPHGQLQGPLKPGQIIQSPGSLSLPGKQQGLVTISTGNTVTINLSAGPEEAAHSFEIVTLPKWKGIEHTNPMVIMPTADRTTVKVVLDKASEEEYSLSRPTDERLPLVISREVSAIRFLTPAKPGEGDNGVHSILDDSDYGDANDGCSVGEEDTGASSVGKRSLSEDGESSDRARKRVKLPNVF